MTNFDLKWLKEKGFFKKEIFLEISGKTVFADDENLLAYLEISKTDELEKMKRELSDTKFTYMWFYFPLQKRIRVFRRFGEVKWFYYSPEVRSDYLKSRTDKLSRLKPDSLNILFDVRDIIGDSQNGVRTIPIFLGIKKTKNFLLFLNSILVIWMIFSYKFFSRYFFVLIFAIAYGYLYILHFCREGIKNSKSLDVVVDGEFIIIAFLASIISLFNITS